MMNRDSRTSYPITNLLTGVSQISWSREGSRMAFASFYNGGYDIYILNNPLEIEAGSVELRKTAFLEKRDKEKTLAAADAPEVPLLKPVMGDEDRGYKNFVFGDDFRRNRREEKERSSTFLDEEEYKGLDGSYKPKKYRIRFTPDIVTGGAGYSQFFGLQGNSMIVLSDILGNHQMNIYTDLFYNLKNSTFQFAYYYLPKRIDLGVSLFHYSYLYYTYYSDGAFLYPAFLRDRYYGGSVMASRPFDRFRRVDLGLTFFGIERDYGQIDPYAYYYGYSNDLFQNEENIYRRRIVLLNAAYKTDTVVWGMTGPVNGGRSNFAFSYSPMVSERYGLDFWTFRADWRKYIRVKKDFTFAFRVAGGISGGKHPQRFLLGGMMGWINYQYQRVTQQIWGTDMFYFSSFETPLRGFPYYEMIGTQFFLSNIEIRVPLIRYLILGFPLPLNFQNIRGVVFLDVGSAWNDDTAVYPFGGKVIGLPGSGDIRAGYGFGARVNLGFLLLKYDLAWGTDFSRRYEPVHYFTMGAEF
jgi:outer membrane protein assembly factor BamA